MAMPRSLMHFIDSYMVWLILRRRPICGSRMILHMAVRIYGVERFGILPICGSATQTMEAPTISCQSTDKTTGSMPGCETSRAPGELNILLLLSIPRDLQAHSLSIPQIFF